MRTVGLIVLAVLIVPLAMLLPSWISTTQDSFQARDDADAMRDSMIFSSSLLVPSQITPWMFGQIDRMKEVESPAEWNATSFTAGPCDAGNLSGLPSGKYADAISDACIDLHQIQVDYAGDCRSIQVCELSDTAVARLDQTRAALLEAFADSGFVTPYQREEEPAR